MRVADWFIFILYLASTIFIGLWKSRGGKDVKGYFLGERDLPWWAVGLSVMATQASAITFIGTTGQAFNDGMRFIQIYLPLPLVVVILCVRFVPFFYRANVYTAYEYLERRFDAKTRTLTSLLFQLSRGMGVGIILYAPSVVLSVILGWDERFTIMLMGVTTLIYTALGGVRAVVWTDTMQMLLMFFGVLLGPYLMISGLPEGISFSDAVYLGGANKRWNAINPSLDLSDPYTLLSGLLGGFFLMLSYFGCDQSQVQRYITARSIKESRMSLMMTAILKVPMQFLILATGVLLMVFYNFERPPAFFNPADINKALNDARTKDEFLKRQEEFLAAFEQRRAAALRLLEARRRGDQTEQLLADYRRSDQLLKEARSRAVKVIESAGGAKSSDVNYVYPSFLLRYAPAGLLGLMISVIFAAAMSSISAELAALSSATMIDIYRKHLRPMATEAHYLRASRICTLAWGAFATMVATYAGKIGASLVETVNKVGSHFYGPILGVFLLAMLIRKSNGHGAFWGTLAGFIAVVYVSWGTQIPWLYYNVVGAAAVLIIGTLVSLIAAPARAIAPGDPQDPR
jgi:Na+/proline symporter